MERPIEQVESDVRRMLVSSGVAEQDYGVVIGDAERTVEVRDRIRAERGRLGSFEFGPLPEGFVTP